MRRPLFSALFASVLGITVFACSDDPPPAQTNFCPAYCQEIAAECGGLNAQYIRDDNKTCTAMCALMTQGKFGDETGDTVACRRRQISGLREILTRPAGVPANETPGRKGPCGAAGAFSTVCGPPDECEALCSYNQRICSGNDRAFASQAECVTACKKTAISGFDILGLPDQTSGDTRICRAYHLQAASTDRSLHCPHTKLGPGPCN